MAGCGVCVEVMEVDVVKVISGRRSREESKGGGGE